MLPFNASDKSYSFQNYLPPPTLSVSLQRTSARIHSVVARTLRKKNDLILANIKLQLMVQYLLHYRNALRGEDTVIFLVFCGGERTDFATWYRNRD